MHMKIKITFRKYSESDWNGYSSTLIDEKILPIKLGIIEECQLFKITEINDKSVKVAYREGEQISIGTFATTVEAKWNANYEPEKEIKIDEGITVTRSTLYNESVHGEMYSLQLIYG